MVAGLLAAAATALTMPAPTVITPQHWLERPTGKDIGELYPEGAQRAGVGGKAILECHVAADGRMERCRVFAEGPKRYGFGLAALRMAPKFRVAPPSRSEGDAESLIDIPIQMFINKPPGPGQLELELDDPRWTSAPTFEDLARAFPSGSKVAAADVTLGCHVASSGALETCKTRSERPSRQGFAQAALALAGKFRVDFGPYLAQPIEAFVAEVSIQFTDPGGDLFRNRRIDQPKWIATPTQSQAAALFPDAAKAKGLKTGRGIASCAVAPDGRLVECVPLPADPDGLGFSEAAVKIAAAMRMNPWTDAGGPVNGARVELPIRFNLSPDTH